MGWMFLYGDWGVGRVNWRLGRVLVLCIVVDYYNFFRRGLAARHGQPRYFTADAPDTSLSFTLLVWSSSTLLARLAYLSTRHNLLVMASIKANCRKVVCIGRNYAYTPDFPFPPAKHFSIAASIHVLTYQAPKRPHNRALKCPPQKALLFPKTPLLAPPSQKRTRVTAKRRELAL